MPKGCSKCGTQNAVVAKFCRGCGNALSLPPVLPEVLSAATEVKCPVCGALNATSAHFCAHCGADQSDNTVPGAFHPAPEPIAVAPAAPSVFPKTPPRPASARAAPRASIPPPEPPLVSPPPTRPTGLWIGLGVVAVALIAGVWWFKSPHGSVASLNEPAASAPVAAPIPLPITPAPAAVVDPAPLPASAPEPAAPVMPAAAPVEVDAASAAAHAKEKAAREARAKALREQREQAASQAAADLDARKRAEELRARPVPATPPTPVQVPAPATVAAPQPRTAQELCAGGNPIAQGICEARECFRREHTDEALCKRLRAADDKRREQN
ncbi:MAG: zinc ribbon domain-containing protein [Burkholderiales bacterium]